MNVESDCCCHLGEQEPKQLVSVGGRYVPFWDVTAAAKNQLDKISVQSPPGLCPSVFLVDFLISPLNCLLFYERGFGFNTAVACRQK